MNEQMIARAKMIDWLNAFKADPFATGADKVDRLLSENAAYNPDDRLREALEAEKADLIHDLERQMTIANIECNLAEDAREALRQCRRLAAMESSALAKAIIETVDTALSPLPQGDNAIRKGRPMSFAKELLRYGQHGQSCPRYEYFGNCICGWDTVRRAALDAALDRLSPDLKEPK